MEKKKSYCKYVASLTDENVHKIYHDTQYGFKLKNDNELFGRLILEINQAGLSWTTILNKQDNFREAYSNFQILKVANYDEKDIDRLLNNKGIIRNRLKINAAIFNAQQIQNIQKKYGSFSNWLDQHKTLSLNEWVSLFKKIFKFTGREITKEFLISTAYLEGAHDNSCPIYLKITTT